MPGVPQTHDFPGVGNEPGHLLTFKHRLVPGDFVVTDTSWSELAEVPLMKLASGNNNDVVGWFRRGTIALVIAVEGDCAYLWCRDRAHGWVNRLYVCSLQDFTIPSD